MPLKDPISIGQCARALVIKLRSHCEVLLATPVLSVLAARGVEVDALVYDDTAPMLEAHPALSQLHLVGRDWRAMGRLARLVRESRLFRELRLRRYALIVHLCDDARGAWLARALGAGYSVAPERGDRAWKKSFTHLYLVAARRPAAEADLDALRRIGIQPEPAERKIIFVPGPEAERRIAALVNDEFVQVHLAARVAAWPAARQAALIDRLAAAGRQVVVTGGPDERHFVEEVLGAARFKPLDLVSRLSLKELGALAARARMFYGADGVALHLASAVETPTMLLSPGGEEAPWRPWTSASAAVRELAGPA